jgi:AraC family transcriptional regulator
MYYLSRGGAGGRMSDHLDQLARAIDFIEGSLDRPFALAPAAREAGMSAFHFSRVFHSITGESVSEYARKRRLTRAASLLLGSSLPVIDVALSCGFESQEAFTRAFKRWYGAPPARFRRRGLPYMLRDRPPLAREDLAGLVAGEVALEPRLEERRDSLFIGVACDNSARKNDIPRAWRSLLRRMAEIAAPLDRSTYGIYRYDFAEDAARIGEDFPFRYLAALEASPAERVSAPSGMEIWAVGAARHAVFEHRGPLRKLGATYRYIYKTWFPRQGSGLAAAPFFERRAPDYPGDREDAVTEIWIPMEG